MFWKNWPYWLKGGLMFAGIFIFIFIAGLLLTQVASHFPNPTVNYLILLSYAPRIPILMLPPFNSCLDWWSRCFMGCGEYVYKQKAPSSVCNGSTFYILLIFLGILFYFIIGAIIGLIYGKIKNKK